MPRSNDGWTPSGRQLMASSDSDTQRRSEAELLFSGWVDIRLKGMN